MRFAALTGILLGYRRLRGLVVLQLGGKVHGTISLLLAGTEVACATPQIDIHMPMAKRMYGTDILSPPFP